MNETTAFFIELFKILHQRGDSYLFECPICQQNIMHVADDPVCLLSSQVAQLQQMHIPSSTHSACICESCNSIICLQCCIDVVIQTERLSGLAQQRRSSLSIQDDQEELKVTDSTEYPTCPVCAQVIRTPSINMDDCDMQWGSAVSLLVENIQQSTDTHSSDQSEDEDAVGMQIIVVMQESYHEPLSMVQYMQLVSPRIFSQQQHSCSICLQDQLITDYLMCGHDFCRECLIKAFGFKLACPMCRAVPQVYQDVKDDSINESEATEDSSDSEPE